MPLTALRNFLKTEAAGGVVLMIAAVAALIWANSAAAPYYSAILSAPVGVRLGAVGLEKDLILWINDGLMAIFFLLVGLEIKREALVGELSSRERAALPAFAAVGGMAIPALIYVLFNLGATGEEMRGWAIPAATDIAFAVGVLALLGDRVPASLRIFLLALAIIDDLGAIVIIALFYTSSLNLTALGLAALALAVLVAFNRLGVRRIAPYMLVGAILWLCVLKSGVHATLAGVAIAFTIPLTPSDDEHSPLETLEHALHPWVAFAIMPIFALANAGVSLAGLSFSSLLEPVPLGIALGLFLGKQLGVFGFAWAAIKAGWCARPHGASLGQMYGVSIITGIGFTMSLFIGNLAFETEEHATAVRLGVLGGSLLSALVGYAVLAALGRRRSAIA
ncbi:MAG TPA: Na+/H+ antiporter NhaA [Azospirillaceae bacterium]|nr:Na+/H+ antiporter NhaA [Azospirillaceae bacterium]HRQ80579.1 Na+/H+ antiporter NhaA [Azospirillaceae bacterium]